MKTTGCYRGVGYAKPTVSIGHLSLWPAKDHGSEPENGAALEGSPLCGNCDFSGRGELKNSFLKVPLANAINFIGRI